MQFNSPEFTFFLPIVFTLYWAAKNKPRIQNILIVFVSYLFYSWWDWRFIALISLSTVVDFLIGIQLGKTTILSRRKLLLALSVTINLGILGLFKYSGFFLHNLNTTLSIFGFETQLSTLKFLLPIGIRIV